MSTRALTISIFTLWKNGHLEIVEQRSRLAAMLNICLKHCSRPQKKKKKKSSANCFSWNTLWSDHHRRLEWNVTNNIWTIKWRHKDESTPRVTGGILIRSLCIFIIVCPTFQEESTSDSWEVPRRVHCEAVSNSACSAGETWSWGAVQSHVMISYWSHDGMHVMLNILLYAEYSNN